MPSGADAFLCVPTEERRLMADKTYTLAFAQQVSRPLPEVFAFFSRAENLEVLTSPWLNFKISLLFRKTRMRTLLDE
jgi:hypothetical protein